jgi:hypothetical protein
VVTLLCIDMCLLMLGAEAYDMCAA